MHTYFDLKTARPITVEGHPARLLAVRLRDDRLYGGVVFDKGIELLNWIELPDAAYEGLEFTYHDQRGAGADGLRALLRAAAGGVVNRGGNFLGKSAAADEIAARARDALGGGEV